MRPAMTGVVTVAIAALLIGCSDPPPDFEFFDACDPKQVPDADCYAGKRDPDSARVALATDIALRYIAEHPADDEAWNWEEGVLMYAMTELYRVTGDTRIRDYYKAYIDHHIAIGYDVAWSDGCPPALAAIALYDELGGDDYRAIPELVMTYLAEIARRTEEGGISHLGALNIVTLWVDSLFMFGMVLNRWGELTGDRKLLDEMGDQLDIFADKLQSDSGWLVHAYNWPQDVDTDIYWARGNSWVTVSAADYLRARLLRHERDDRAQEILDRQIAAAIADQDASGGWWSIVNRPNEIYLETSGTALIGYGMARAWRYGLAGDEVRQPIEDAVGFVESKIETDDQGRPFVTDISGPTMAGEFQDYANVALEDDLSYGVGGAILVLIESSGLP